MTNCWRIDDLARETGLTVDTIRYYQREGLMPPGAREGRHRVYGPEHVQRLRRIKELQGRRFSIAAIRAMVSSDGSRLDSVFADEGESLRLSLDELLERSTASAELVAELQDARVLRDPQDFGRTAYDGDDLEMLRAMARLERVGIPPKALRVLGRIYADGIEVVQRSVVEVFVSGTGIAWEGDELDRFRQATSIEAKLLLSSMRRLVDYTHHRTLQRVTLDAVERTGDADPDAPRVDPDATDPGSDLPAAGGLLGTPATAEPVWEPPGLR